MRRSRRSPAERDLRLPDIARHFAKAEPRDTLLDLAGKARGFARGQRTVLSVHLLDGIVGIDVADDRQNGVAGMVEVAVEADERLARQRAEPWLASDAPPPDSVHVVEQLVQRLGRDGARIVGLALRFLDDHLELARELVGIDQRASIGVGLHVEPLGEARRRQHRVVARVIVDRRRIQVSADRLGLLGDLTHAARRRALEVHVLQHVRDTDDVVRLVEVSGADERDDRNDRSRPVATDEHREPVRQSRPDDGFRVDRARRFRNWHRCRKRRVNGERCAS
jgi:hypothetical protein